MTGLSDHTNDELNNLVQQMDSAIHDLVSVLDAQQPLLFAVKSLVESSTPFHDFKQLIEGNPDYANRIFMAGLSTLINTHSRETVRRELERRMNAN